MTGCVGCDAEQGTINQRFQKAIQDAESIAGKEGKKVAVIVAGQDFEVQIITDKIPGGTAYIAPQLQHGNYGQV